jgi:hypothetical protein
VNDDQMFTLTATYEDGRQHEWGASRPGLLLGGVGVVEAAREFAESAVRAAILEEIQKP